MPEVVLFRDAEGRVPVLDWLAELPDRARDLCWLRLELLAEWGHHLRRPHAEHLGSGVYELRLKHRGVNHRLFYFFHGREIVVLTHGMKKQQARVPPDEIMRVLRCRAAFERDPGRHTFRRVR